MALPSSKKTHLEQHKQILKQLLKEDANRTCADCKVSKNPRWASWNLGCFICIRCSGIHRSMGTHISKVKSVDLDAWTDDQIENMVKWGNANVNQYWEDKLPSGYIPDQLKIENFIRTKYDLRKWTMSKNLPDPLSLNKNKAATTATIQQPKHESKSHSNTTLLNDINLLDDNSGNKSNDEEFGSFTATRSPHKRSNKLAPPPTKTVLPAAPTTSSSPQQQHQHQPLQSAQNTGGSVSSMGRPDLKKSILSLYASPSSSNSFIQQQQQQQQQPQQPLGMNSLSNSLSSLNIQGGNSTTNNNNVYRSSNTVNTQNNHTQRHPLVNSTPSLNNNQPKQNWNNEWTTDTFTSSPSIPSTSASSLAGTSNYKTTSSLNVNGLDDDLFKNVWG